MGRVDIGFLEDCEPWRLASRFFPSKIGGKPAWLDLKNIPNKQEIACEYCSAACLFLCQVYAPFEEDTSAFHRTIYVFICKNGECCRENKNGNLKVLRSQLGRVNEFYPSEPPEDNENWRTDITVEKWARTCRVCGVLGPSRCSKCKNASYCSREHQILDWKNGHKSSCGGDTITKSGSILFPEYELVTEVEESSESNSDNDESEDEGREIKKYEALTEDGSLGTRRGEEHVELDLLEMASRPEDEAFSRFTKKIQKYPDQVLRYERGGIPLYISSIEQPKAIPNCQGCGEERQFEFQIMPQLLNSFTFENIRKDLDWGILAVFTCKNSCVPKDGYAAEYIWKQDIA